MAHNLPVNLSYSDIEHMDLDHVCKIKLIPDSILFSKYISKFNGYE